MRRWLACVVFVAAGLSACTSNAVGDSAAEPTQNATSFATSTSAVTAGDRLLEARTGAAVVWTGTELIVSGGFAAAPNNAFDDAAFLTDGAAYDLASMSWRHIAPSPARPMTWPDAVWTGEQMLIVGSAGGWAFDPGTDKWTTLPDAPFPLPDLVRDNETFETAWSGELLYVWRPATNEMGFYDPDRNEWETMPGPGLDASPTRLLADDSRLVALGTGWPGSGVPVSYEVAATEWVQGQWVQREPVTFVTDRNRNIADVNAAVMIDRVVVVWGAYSDDPGPTYLLDVNGSWTAAPSMPLRAGTGHPGSIELDRRVVALTEGSSVAIFDIDTQTWIVHETSAASGLQWPSGGARQSMWTGFEVLTWTGADILSWIPPG